MILALVLTVKADVDMHESARRSIKFKTFNILGDDVNLCFQAQVLRSVMKI